MAMTLSLISCAEEKANPVVEEEDPPVVQVGSVTITLKQLREFTRDLHEEFQSKKEGIEREKDHLQTMIDKEILLLEAANTGIDKTPSVLEKMHKIKRNKVLNTFALREIKVDREKGEVKEFIEKEGLSRAVKFSQIVVESEERAKAVIQELKAGKSFEEVAEKWSSAEEMALVIGGRADGYSPKANTHPRVREQLFSLEVGAVSEPIEFSSGRYTIVKATADTTIDIAPESMQQVFKQLYAEKYYLARAALAAKLKEEYRPELDQEGLSAFLEEMRDLASFTPEDEQNIILYRYGNGKGKITAKDLLNAAEARKMKPEDLMDGPQVISFAEDSVVPDAMFLEAALRAGIDKEEDIAAWLDNQRQDLILTELRAKALERGNLEPSEEEVRAYYDSHPDDFKNPEQIELQEILVETEEEARQLMEQIQQGASLDELAGIHSIRPEEQRHEKGRIHFYDFQKARYGDLVEAAQEAPTGELTGPVAVEGGYSIFKVLSKEREKQTFEKVKRRVRATIRWQRKQKLFEQYLEELRQKYASQVKIWEDNLKTASGAE